MEDQERADQRIQALLQVPARVRFLSCEPLLGLVDLRNVNPWDDFVTDALDTPDPSCRINWVICGGESGPLARPMHPDWARSLRDQCADAGVPFLFKQWGEWAPAGAMGAHCFNPGASVHDLVTANRVGKKSAGRLLDGVEHLAFPEVG